MAQEQVQIQNQKQQQVQRLSTADAASKVVGDATDKLEESVNA